MYPKMDDPFDHAIVSMMRSSMALKCFFTSRGMVVSARTNGSMMLDTSNASSPRRRGIAGNLSVAVLYDATTTSIEHARTLRTRRDEPRSASYPARCAASGAERAAGAGSAVSAASAAMSATLPDPVPRPEPPGRPEPPPPPRGSAVSLLCSPSRMSSMK